MRIAGHFILCLAALACPAASVLADDLAMASNPYSTITERNVFALVPVPIVSNEPVAPPVEPPAKITINGMMTIFGKPQVLIKFTPKSPPGQPAKEVSLVLGEGERDQGVEVTKIDMLGHTASFINQGVAQDVALSDTAKITAPAAGAGPMSPGGPVPVATSGGIPMPTVTPSIPTGLLGRGGLGGRGPGTTAGGASPSSMGTAATVAKNGTAANAENLTAEERAILIEAQRLKLQDDKNPMANMLPPTKFTPRSTGAVPPPSP